jgi:RNA polymerase sigma-70 factor (sigma-E family)
VSNPPEFAAFYTATWPRLFRITFAITGDRHLAEDALQTAFGLAYAAWDKVQRADDPSAYVRRIVVNAAIGQRRLAFRRREFSTDALPEPGQGVDDEIGTRHQVWAAVQALPVQQRAVVVLRFYEDMSEQQIADALGCRPGTVKSHASRALANLRGSLHQSAAEGGRA